MKINTVVSSRESKSRAISSDFALQLPWGMIYCMIKLYSEFHYTRRFNPKLINGMLRWILTFLFLLGGRQQLFRVVVRRWHCGDIGCRGLSVIGITHSTAREGYDRQGKQ
jgi:hypothetical protein